MNPEHSNLDHLDGICCGQRTNEYYFATDRDARIAALVAKVKPVPAYKAVVSIVPEVPLLPPHKIPRLAWVATAAMIVALVAASYLIWWLRS